MLHVLLGAGTTDNAGHDEAPWVPRPDMLAAAVGLPPRALPGLDARVFVEQAVLAVCTLGLHCCMSGWC